jgi:2-amino-4-hydroxy-6-hydroxymethyldihydropteridine diphosphokinase
MVRVAYVGLGSNLGSPRENVVCAMDRLQHLSDEPIVRSSIYETDPVDCPPDSPRFANAVVALVPRPDETPESLLGKLQAIEREFGRHPKQVHNEPRPLDLDLIAFGDETRGTAQLVLPHPRVHHRRFVLEPLAEIAPDLVLPGQTATVAGLSKMLS